MFHSLRAHQHSSDQMKILKDQTRVLKLKVSNRNPEKMCEIYSKSTIEIPKQRH